MAAPPGTMMITVPEGCPPGGQIQVTAPNGQPLMVPVPPGHGPGSTFAVRVPGPPAPPAQPVLVQPTVVSAPGMPVPPQPGYAQPTPAQNYAALAAANAPQPQTAPLSTPKGPCLLVDHIDVPGDGFSALNPMSLGVDRGGQAFAGYVADDLDGAGAKPAYAAVIRGCRASGVLSGQDVPQGLVVPIYPSAVDQKGQIEWTGSAVAELHLDNLQTPCCKCNDPLSAKVTKDGQTYEIVSESGRCMRLCVCIPCQPCFADSDMTLGEGAAQVRLKGAKTKPCCDCNRKDTTVFRSVQGEAAAGMHRAVLTTEAALGSCLGSKGTRELVRHKRHSGVWWRSPLATTRKKANKARRPGARRTASGSPPRTRYHPRCGSPRRCSRESRTPTTRCVCSREIVKWGLVMTARRAAWR